MTSYQGLRISKDGGIYVRHRIKGQIVEQGPYVTAAEALLAQNTAFKPALDNSAGNRGGPHRPDESK